MFAKRIPFVIHRCLAQRTFQAAQLKLSKSYTSDASVDKHHSLTSRSSKLALTSQTTLKDADIITEQLHKAKSIDKVLELVSQHHGVMNNSQVLSAFDCLFEAAREAGTTDYTAITSQPSFRELCNRALKRMRFYEIEDTISLFKMATFFKIPANTGLVQAIAQMLRHSINTLSLQQLMFINSLLVQQKNGSSLTEALKMAVPLVFQTQLPIQLDFTNAEDVVQCFKFAYQKELDPALIEKLAVSLLSHVPNLTSEQAATLVLTVGLTAPSASSAIPGVLDLVTAAERVVVSNLGSFPPKAIRAFLSCFMRGFYSKDLLEALVRKGMQEGWELWQMSLLLQGCLRAKYATPELSEYVAERVVKEAGTVSDDGRVSIVVFAQAAAACPKNAPTFREAGQVLALCRDKLHLAQLAVPHLFVSTAVSLASLHCYPKEVLDVAFSEEFLSKARFKVPQKRWAGMLRDLLQLEQGVRIELKGGYEGPLLPESLRQEAIALVARESSTLLPLKKSLEVALGGGQFLKAALWTRHGYFVDFAVVMRKGEYPMAINMQPMQDEDGEFSYIEDLTVPEDSKILTVVTADASSYWRDTAALRRSVVTKLHHLSTLGYCPLLVNVDQWKSLMDHEKIPYLMREAKAVLSEGDASWAMHMK
ncbi:uncharacterized protein LOC8034039 isoform X2 [Ixodes scapularis]|nr:uncharacterized protein LOC8034039 isoform X2 [Ixodes scapularis]XP_029825424.3 uncharacterized protein LOC8034039 isoform X2 [Ixodes scapularis]